MPTSYIINGNQDKSCVNKYAFRDPASKSQDRREFKGQTAESVSQVPNHLREI